AGGLDGFDIASRDQRIENSLRKALVGKPDAMGGLRDACDFVCGLGPGNTGVGKDQQECALLRSKPREGGKSLWIGSEDGTKPYRIDLPPRADDHPRFRQPQTHHARMLATPREMDATLTEGYPQAVEGDLLASRHHVLKALHQAH